MAGAKPRSGSGSEPEAGARVNGRWTITRQKPLAMKAANHAKDVRFDRRVSGPSSDAPGAANAAENWMRPSALTPYSPAWKPAIRKNGRATGRTPPAASRGWVRRAISPKARARHAMREGRLGLEAVQAPDSPAQTLQRFSGKSERRARYPHSHPSRVRRAPARPARQGRHLAPAQTLEKQPRAPPARSPLTTAPAIRPGVSPR